MRKKIKIQEEKRNYTKIYFIVIIFTIILTNVVFAVSGVGMGDNLVDIENKEAVLSEDIGNLKEEVVNTTSLTKMEERTQELGFEKPASIVYLKREDSVASLR